MAGTSKAKPAPDGFDADVIIAGAGMAGATLALALKHGGLRPLLIDPVAFDAQLEESFDGRSAAISFASFRQWRTLGLAANLEPHAQRIEQILVTDGRRPGASVGPASPFYLRVSPWVISWKTAVPAPPSPLRSSRRVFPSWPRPGWPMWI